MKIQASHGELATLAADAAIVFFYEDSDLFAAQKEAVTAAFPAAAGLFLTDDFKGKKKSLLRFRSGLGNSCRV